MSSRHASGGGRASADAEQTADSGHAPRAGDSQPETRVDSTIGSAHNDDRRNSI